MIKVNLIWGRDLDDLEHRVNCFLENCDIWHYVVRHITFNTSRSDISPSAFVEYETMDNTEEVIEEN